MSAMAQEGSLTSSMSTINGPIIAVGPGSISDAGLTPSRT